MRPTMEGMRIGYMLALVMYALWLFVICTRDGTVRWVPGLLALVVILASWAYSEREARA